MSGKGQKEGGETSGGGGRTLLLRLVLAAAAHCVDFAHLDAKGEAHVLYEKLGRRRESNPGAAVSAVGRAQRRSRPLCAAAPLGSA